jgi:hypothetical protein
MLVFRHIKENKSSCNLAKLKQKPIITTLRLRDVYQLTSCGLIEQQSVVKLFVCLKNTIIIKVYHYKEWE